MIKLSLFKWQMPFSLSKGSFNKSLIIVCVVYLQFVSKHANALITIYNAKNQSIEQMDDYSAQFGPRLPQQGFKGYLALARPLNACSPIQPPPPNVSWVPNSAWIALIQRTQSTNGNCSFDLKVWNAQNAGYSAVIVYNVGSDSLVKMSSSGHYQIKIPSVFIGESDATELTTLYTYLNKTYLVITEDEYNLFAYLIPFAVIVGICFIIMISIFVIKCILYYHTTRKNRLSKSALKKLPTKKYQKTDKYDTCPICLDEYEEGVKLRILPCEHMYHIKCIDEWLLKNNRSCPVCKRKVLPGDDSDDDSSEETSTTRNQHTDNTEDQALINIAENEDDDNETTRLINPSTSNSNNGNNSNTNIDNQNVAAAAAANGTTTIIQMIPSVITSNEPPVQQEQQQQQQVLSTSVASTNSNGSTQYGSIVSTANNSNFTNSIQIDRPASTSPPKSITKSNVNNSRIDNQLNNSRTSPLSANTAAPSSAASSSHFKSADDDDDDELLNELHDKTLNDDDDVDSHNDDDNDDDGDDVALLQPNEEAAAASSSSFRRNKKKKVKDFKIDV